MISLSLKASEIVSDTTYEELVNLPSQLKEWCTDNSLPQPEYKLDKIEGPPHEKVFHMTCTVDEHRTTGGRHIFVFTTITHTLTLLLYIILIVRRREIEKGGQQGGGRSDAANTVCQRSPSSRLN